MAQSIHRESARIYQFPVGGRAGQGDNRQGSRKIADIAPAHHPVTVCGSGWYHEAAIQEAAPARKS